MGAGASQSSQKGDGVDEATTADSVTRLRRVSALHVSREYASMRKRQARKSSSQSPKASIARTTLRTQNALVVQVLRLEGLKESFAEVHVRLSVLRAVGGAKTVSGAELKDPSGESSEKSVGKSAGKSAEKSSELIVLGQGETSKRYNTATPCWMVYRQLVPHCRPSDVLHVEVIFSKRPLVGNMGMGDLLASAECAVADLDRLGGALALDGGLVLHVRRVEKRRGSDRKRLFLLRHGESKWNAAQAKRNVVTMLSRRDHPLNATGIQQAEDLNKRWRFAADVKHDPLNQTLASTSTSTSTSTSASTSASVGVASESLGDCRPSEQEMEASFFQADEVLSSPLTRSVQTALLALRDHPHVESKGLKLFSCAKEVQNLLGKDSMGLVFGDESLERAQTLLAQEGVQTRACSVDPYDVESEWWIATKESKAAVLARMEEFINTVHYCPHEAIIVVGHSLFFRTLFQQLTYADPADPVVQQLQQYKVENCGVVGLQLHFHEQHWPHMRKMASLERLLPEQDRTDLRHGQEDVAAASAADQDNDQPDQDEQPQHSDLLASATATSVHLLFGSNILSHDNDPSMRSQKHNTIR